jgi:phosphopentomutase
VTSPFSRAIVIVLDGVGIGELPDADNYGDRGSDTLTNVARQVALSLPTLRRLGLDRLTTLGGAAALRSAQGAYGRMAEASPGKDSVTGHWELMGLVLERPFQVFPGGFPAGVIEQFSKTTGRAVIGNKTASGTAIIDELGPEHLRTGALIVYTSADSVFQIAAHEDVVPLPELYDACRAAYRLVVEGLGMGRVIARPFVGAPGSFKRTANRRDFAMPPPGDTLLDRVKAAGLPVAAVGKIEDLFAGRGFTKTVHTVNDEEGMSQVERLMGEIQQGLIFANLVDFDTVYGHRNDVEGFARNLERFDRDLSGILPRLRQHDLLVVTADHGNDPTTPGTDHSREYVPLLAIGPSVRGGVDLGVRQTFADLAQTLADIFGVGPLNHGTSFLAEITT